MFKKMNTKILAGTALCLTLIVPEASLAAYVPPQDQVPPRTRGGTAGRRSPCTINDQSFSSGMTALAPISYLGKTIAKHPTFAWFNHGERPPLTRISLYEYDQTVENLKPQPLFSKELQPTQGINFFALPTDQPNLSTDKTYVWQVVALCDQQNPSRNIFVRRPVQVTAVDPLLQQNLNLTQDPVKRLQIYAQAGLWYDAIAIAAHHKTDVLVKKATVALLGDLLKLEASEEPQELVAEAKFSRALQQIVESQQQQSIQ